MIEKRPCQKCKRTITVDTDKHTIDSILCVECWHNWLVFIKTNRERLTHKYPKLCNPTWEVYAGLLTEGFIFR
jgi:hypothetical protein